MGGTLGSSLHQEIGYTDRRQTYAYICIYSERGDKDTEKEKEKISLVNISACWVAAPVTTCLECTLTTTLLSAPQFTSMQLQALCSVGARKEASERCPRFELARLLVSNSITHTPSYLMMKMYRTGRQTQDKGGILLRPKTSSLGLPPHTNT